MGIVDQVKGKSFYLDTNIFIYALEGYEEYVPVLQEIFEAVEQHNFTAYTSELTIAEVLVKPYREKNTVLIKQYLKFLKLTSNLTLVPISQDILKSSAKIRAESDLRVKLPDAIHLSSALSANCSAFVTNDKRLKQTKLINVMLLNDYALSAQL